MRLLPWVYVVGKLFCIGGWVFLLMAVYEWTVLRPLEHRRHAQHH